MMYPLIVILIFSTMCLIFGLGLIITGIWALANDYSLLYYTRYLVYGRADIPGIYLSMINPIIVGVIACIPLIFAIALVSLGILHPRFIPLMIWFAGVTVILVVLQLPIVLAPMIIFPSVTSSSIQSGLVSSMNNIYRGLPTGLSASQTQSLTWDKIMIGNKCCGIYGTVDFASYYGFRATTWYSQYRSYIMYNSTIYGNSSVLVPTSCCQLTRDDIVTNNNFANINLYLNNTLCPITTDGSYKTGCYWDVIYPYLAVYTGVIFSVEMLVLGFEAIVIGTLIYILCASPQDQEPLTEPINKQPVYSKPGSDKFQPIFMNRMLNNRDLRRVEPEVNEREYYPENYPSNNTINKNVAPAYVTNRDYRGSSNAGGQSRTLNSSDIPSPQYFRVTRP